MTPPGQIIDIDAFKKKDESFSSLKSGAKRPEEEDSGLFGGRIDPKAVLLLVVTALFLALIMTPARRAEVTVYPVDSIAPRNVRAAEDLLIEDALSTEKIRQVTQEQVADVYDLDDRSSAKVADTVTKAFALMTAAYTVQTDQAHRLLLREYQKDGEPEGLPVALDEARGALAKFEGSARFAEVEKQFRDTLGVPLGRRDLKTLRSYHYWPMIGTVVDGAVSRIMNDGVVLAKEELPPSTLKGITLRAVVSGKESAVTNFDHLYDLDEAKRRVAEEVAVLLPGEYDRLREVATVIAAQLITPNVTFNRQETVQRRQSAAEAAPPVFFQVKQGEMIIREGDRVTPSQAAKLAHLASRQQQHAVLPVFFGLFLVSLGILSLAGIVVRKFHEEVAENPTLQQLSALLLAGHLFAVWGVARAGLALAPPDTPFGADTFALAAPLVAGPMLISLFFTVEFTVLFTLFAAAFTGLLLRDFTLAPLLTVVGGMICAYQVGTYRRRASVIKVGLITALAFILTTLAFDMITAKFLSHAQLIDAAAVLLGAGITVALVTMITPVIESFYPVVSDIKLMELANPDHPLMRRMLVEAPGTYHHSMMVGYLAEEAAKAIDASALLARAGAMFHDIGKMKKAAYFVENQRDDNPHDRLTPSMSALIVANHVKEGLELAKKHKLLPQIAAMIPEHHGTTVMRYFYTKAKAGEDTRREEVSESDYRYPGPIPSSRESACVALADSIEAAARACAEPTPLRLKGIVTDVIKDKFVQGQLDESHLTLSDLSKIADAFVHVLAAIHHHRIQYPDAPKPEKGKRHDDRAGNAGASGEGRAVASDA